MILTTNEQLFETGVSVLQSFGERVSVRGRFVALYLGLRRMRRLGMLAELDSGIATPAGELEGFLDDLFSKSHRTAPFVVLTALFGRSPSPTAPWSTRTGDVAPANRYATNTWRNNFGVQKGIGCPASPDTIRVLLQEPQLRLACQHLRVDADGRQLCGISGTSYRGDEHSIWLRTVDGRYQVVDLNLPAVYRDYLFPSGQRIPIFALIAALYCFASPQIYPPRQAVGIPEFADDFGFDIETVERLFDCDPDESDNAHVLAIVEGRLAAAAQARILPDVEEVVGAELPVAPEAVLLNSGVGAELAVAQDLANHGWEVAYWGSRRGIGYDLEASRTDSRLRIEVKSSVGFCVPELTEEEWNAAQRYADEFVLAVVDFFGSPAQRIHYIRNPAANITPTERTVVIHRLARVDVIPLSTTAEFL